MKACTFFGHRDSDLGIRQMLKETIERLITENGVYLFYVGNHGNFDRMALQALRELSETYEQLRYYEVLAYMPKRLKPFETSSDCTLLPEGIEAVPKRFAISYRNQWMLKHSDHVIAYVTRPVGGAATYRKKALNAKKTVIDLSVNESV